MNVRETYLGAGGSELKSFTTPTARPVVGTPSTRNVTGTSAYLTGGLTTGGSETEWRFEYASSVSGPWSPVEGAEGTSQVQAEGGSVAIEGAVTGLSPAKVYYVRIYARNKTGEGETCHEEKTPGPKYGKLVCEAISGSAYGIQSFETAGPPAASTLATHALHGESLRLLGSVNPKSVPTSAEQTVTLEGAPSGGTFTLTFDGQSTVPVAFNASGETVSEALSALAALKEGVSVTGVDGGPYRVFFGGVMGGVSQPPIIASSSFTPSGAVNVVTVQEGGLSYATHYHFQYVGQKSFEELEWEQALDTAPVDLGSGDSPEVVGQDLPTLQPGESYHYRIVASNTSPGDPLVYGAGQTLSMPVAASTAPEEVCPNQEVRTGSSASLPDCRAYEQVTPVDKEGAQEIFRYQGLQISSSVLVGEDGDHVMLEAPVVKWGSSASSGQSPYFFVRDPRKGWVMTSATAQPEAGLDEYLAHVFDSDLSAFGFEAGWGTLAGAVSPNVEFRAGPPGGPYVTAATVPRKQAAPGWVAASADFSSSSSRSKIASSWNPRRVREAARRNCMNTLWGQCDRST